LFVSFILISLTNKCNSQDTTVRIRCETTKGNIRIQVYPQWAPTGAARFIELVETGFFTDVGLTRVLSNFLVQFGIAADPQLQKQWEAKGNLLDDPTPSGTLVKRGTMAYAGGGKDSRTTQVWIAFKPNRNLGTQLWETPFGEVLEEDMHVVDSFYAGYGDMEAFGGHGPDQGRQHQDGNEYLRNQFPQLDYVKKCWRVDSFDSAFEPAVSSSSSMPLQHNSHRLSRRTHHGKPEEESL